MKEYLVCAIDFENNLIHSLEFDEKFETLDYMPTQEQLIEMYGKGSEYVDLFIITDIETNEEIEIKGIR